MPQLTSIEIQELNTLEKQVKDELIYYRPPLPLVGTLIYPGAGKDRHPINLAADSFIDQIIYIDYNIRSIENIRTFATSLSDWSLSDFNELKPKDFGKKSWGQFWPSDPASYRFCTPEHSCAATFQLTHISGKHINFSYLGTEAIQTCKVLAQQGLSSHCFWLKDHGFGLNWTHFGGDTLANYLTHDQLPEFVLVHHSTEAPVGYYPCGLKPARGMRLYQKTSPIFKHAQKKVRPIMVGQKVFDHKLHIANKNNGGEL